MSPDVRLCPPVDDLERLLAEQLSGHERDTLESHIELCSTCQARLEQLSSQPPRTAAVREHSASDDAEPRAEFLRRLYETPPASPSGPSPTEVGDEIPMWFERGRIGQYEVLEKLGKGGMGTVYKARHVELGKIVAIKVLKAAQLDEVRIGRFKNEIRSIGRLNHPHIVAAHDAGEIGGVHYLVMDFVDGDDLGRVVERHGRLSVADACEAVRQAALGLQHAFECGLVHRDIKPSNLMLTRGGRVQLLDLGLARSFRDRPAETLTAEGMVLGTADYLAPEQWEHAHTADIRADIYSLGCTLYHLLSGRPPFAGRRYGSLVQKLRGHVDTPHAPITEARSEVPAELAAILDRMLAKSPTDRFASPAEVAEALRPFTDGSNLGRLVEPGRTPAPSAAAVDTADAPNTVTESRSRAGQSGSPRRYAMPGTAAVAAIAFMVALVVWWPRRDRSSEPAATPIAIDEMRVNHFRGQQARELGDIRTSEEIRKGDDVRVFAKFNQAAHCYLIAFNPDGTQQLCHPAFEGTDLEKARTLAPPPVTEFRFFPDDKGYFGLDSAGLQVFVLVASARPLPPYAEWRAGIGAIPWRAVRHGGESRWQFDGRDFARLSEVRGSRQERDPVPTPLRELCEFFKSIDGLDVVRVIAFPVTDVDQASRLKALELDLAREGKYEEALQPVRELIAHSIKEKGKDHWQTRDHERELKALETIAALPKPDRDEYTRALLALDESVTLQTQGQYPEGALLAKKALDVMQRDLGADHLVSAQVAVHYANLLRQSAKLVEAETVLREVLVKIDKAVGEDHPTAASVRTCLALVFDDQAKSDRVRPLLDKALEISRRLRGDDHSDVAVVLNNLGGHYERQAMYADAEPYYRQALDILVRVDGEEGRAVATTRHNLAHCLSNQGKYGEGEDLYREVLRVRRKILPDGHPDIGMTCNNLAYNLDLQGRHTEAQGLYREVYDIYLRRFGPDNPYTAMAENGLALNLQNQGKFEAAEPRFENALRVYAATGYAKSRAAATAHNNLASNLRAQRRYDAAREQSEKALAIFRDGLGESHPETALGYNNVAAIFDDQKKFAEAEKLIRKAIAIFEERLGRDHPNTVLARANLAANLHNQEKYAEADAGHREALESYRRLMGEGHPGTAWTYKNLITNCWVRGDYPAALELGPAAVKSFETARRRISFSGLDRVHRTDEISPHRHLAAIAARTGRVVDAWRYLEGGLARGLLDDMVVRPLTDDERARQQQLVRELDRLDEQIAGLLAPKATSDRAKAEAEKLRKQRDEAQGRLARLQAELAARYGPAAGKMSELAEIQKALPSDAALVTWLDIAGDPTFKDPSGEHWACVVRSAGEPVWERLPGTGPNHAWVDEDYRLSTKVRESMASSPSASKGDWKEAAASLYRQRVKPIEKALEARDGLPAVRRLIVLPSSQMAGIPLEALTERFTVSYAPSGSVLAWIQLERRDAPARDAATRRSLLAIGDPAFGPADQAANGRGKSLAPLPGTANEVHALTRLFSRSQLLLGPEASEPNLDRMAAAGELRKFRFLHFATHGLLDDRRPLASALVLARHAAEGTAYDGLLTAEQILRTWKLDAELVTLSACETALGKFSRGEGYLGFSQALFLAGARSMVLSLWPVDDRATTLVMTRFYENMLGTPDGSVKALPKAEALAEAKRWVSALTVSEVDRLTADLPRGLPGGTRGVRRESDPAPSGHAPRPFAHPYYWSSFILIGDPR
jgi:CHAT domain-containing protein/serine/threonine protein kinase